MIKITDAYWFEVDEYQHKLYRRTVREKMKFRSKEHTGETKEFFEFVGYYKDVDAMLKAAVRDAVMLKAGNNEFQTIDDYLKSYSELVKQIIGHANVI